MKVNAEQKKQINLLREEGLSFRKIAVKLNIPLHLVYYQSISRDKRKKLSQERIKAFRDKPLSYRQKVYKKRLPYIREYLNKRYNEDLKFRNKKKEEVRKRYYKKLM